MEDHVNRNARLGTSVLINAEWYERSNSGPFYPISVIKLRRVAMGKKSRSSLDGRGWKP